MAAERAPAVTGGADERHVRVVSAGARGVGAGDLVVRPRPGRRAGGGGGDVHGVAASPDGTRALAARGDGTVVEWDVVTGVERAAFLRTPARRAPPRTAADGALLGKALSGGDDGVVRLWTVVDGTSSTTTATFPKKTIPKETRHGTCCYEATPVA